METDSLRNRRPNAGTSDEAAASASPACRAKESTDCSRRPMNRPAAGLGIVLGNAAIAGAAYYIHKHVDCQPNGMEDANGRLVFAIRCLGVSVVPLIMIIFRTMFNRVRNLDGCGNPLAGGEHRIVMHQKILQNTLEQFIIHAVSVLALSTYLCPATVKFIPLICGAFVVGRLAFWMGYPHNRAFGFGITFTSTMLAWGATAYLAYTKGIHAQ